jgi:phosphoribosylamine--glycine ligase
MRILVIGSGGREHALVWRLAQSAERPKLFAIPGNPGMAQLATLLPIGDGSPYTLLAAAESVHADLTVVGPEAPLVAGVVDAFRAAGRKIVGPTAAAAQLEGSKIFAKQFFHRLGIPTAAFVSADTPEQALKALNRFEYPVVIKTDGLAAGKGVVIAPDRAAAESAIRSLGGRMVVEEFLAGEEVSFIALTDGRNVVPLAPTQDHKTAFDSDKGPNTGGMGAYCDSRILTEAETTRILDTIIRPTVAATQFTGFLYAGLMMTANGPKILEYNVRLGDPETQPPAQNGPRASIARSSIRPVGRRYARLDCRAVGMRRDGLGRISGKVRHRPADLRHRNRGSIRRYRLPCWNQARRAWLGNSGRTCLGRGCGRRGSGKRNR